jgi:phosphate transport system substrate-binding protein
MRLSLSRRARRVALGGTAFVALATVAAACDYGPDGDPDVVAFVGSDTTQDVVGELVDSYDADLAYNDDPNIPGDDRDNLENVLSVEANPHPVPGDEDCPSTITYHSPPGPGEVVAPNGSTAGRDALKVSVLAGDGCIDIARSSAGPRAIGTGTGQDPATFEYYAYALDAVGYSTASSAAPANLTLAQLRGIYNCTFTNWNQVGGSNQQIERYFAQPGSGTGPFFQNDVLGFDPNAFSGPNCPAVQFVQENQGLSIFFNGDQQSGIMNYSGANWIAMANGAIEDQRAGQVIRNLDGQNITFFNGTSWTPATPAATGNPAAPVQEANVRLVDPTPDYVGVRFVFNVTDTSADSYLSALRYIGFDNVDGGATSPLCGGGKASILTQFGFGPLDNTTSPRNVPGSVCRLY